MHMHLVLHSNVLYQTQAVLSPLATQLTISFIEKINGGTNCIGIITHRQHTYVQI